MPHRFSTMRCDDCSQKFNTSKPIYEECEECGGCNNKCNDSVCDCYYKNDTDTNKDIDIIKEDLDYSKLTNDDNIDISNIKIIELENINNSKEQQIELLKNENAELLIKKAQMKTIIADNTLILQNYYKKLLNYYNKKLDTIVKTSLDSKCNTYYTNVTYLRYNYNCGVLNYKLGNYKKAIIYYEEAAYNKYHKAQKALSYFYNHGIYYKQSVEKANIWYNLFCNNPRNIRESDEKDESYESYKSYSNDKIIDIHIFLM